MSLVKARLVAETGEELEVRFNPSELTINKSNQWKAAKAKGKNTPPLRFQQGQSGTLVVKLLFDTTHDGSPVTDATNTLMEFMRVDTSLRGSDRNRNMGRPPWVRFQWGQFASFKAIMEKLQVKFTLFADDGTPLRANADVTMKQYEDEEAWAPQNPTSGVRLPHTVHRVQVGESIDRIAAVHYGDPTKWRTIADANGVIDPLTLAPGTDLLIPEPEVVHRA